MIKGMRAVTLVIAISAVMALPGITWASPIFHVAPQWPGGGLNGSEAARTARHDAHTDNRRLAPTAHPLADDDLDNIPFDPIVTSPQLDVIATREHLLEGIDGTAPIVSALIVPQVLRTEGSSLPIAAPLTNDLGTAALAAIPEPGSLLLVGSGVATVIARARRRRQAIQSQSAEDRSI